MKIKVENISKNFKQAKKKQSSRKKLILSSFILACFVLPGSLLFNSNDLSDKRPLEASMINFGAFEIIPPTVKYGFVLDSFHITESTIQKNQFLSDLLLQFKVDYADIDKLVRATNDIFDVRNFRVGKPYMVLNSDTSDAADYFIYEPSVYNYLVYDLKNHTLTDVKKEVVTQIESASGIIESSLWQTMIDNELDMELTAKMEDALAWSVDFHHIQKEDRFKLIYEQHYIDGSPVGVGEIRAAYFKNGDNDFYAFYFENDVHSGFYDLEARPMEKAFLKSPVKYSRISSRYNLRRFHPILRRTKAHLGTDYAAPYGTPIFAVADGVVTHAAYSGGNGNYVKIKHDKVYQTQYLHMSKFAKGIRPGVHVKQGETIGYVGATGLATGPHVCFRFWKNGRQVNHLRENLPPPEPMAEKDIPRFNILKDTMKKQLDLVQYRVKKTDDCHDEHEPSVQTDTISSNP
jgi:murein DD-endopeptidase MepM/ murein hydrolase activator NlpD